MKSQIITIEAQRVDEDGGTVPPRIPVSLSRRKAAKKVERCPNTIRSYEKLARVLIPGYSDVLGCDIDSPESAGEGVRRIKRSNVSDRIEIKKGKNQGTSRKRFPLTEYQIWVLRQIANLHERMVSRERVKNYLSRHKAYYSYESWAARKYQAN